MSTEDFYDTEDPYRPNLYLTTAHEMRNYRQSIKVVHYGITRRDSDAYSDPAWGRQQATLMQLTREFFGITVSARKARLRKPPQPNSLTVDSVIMPSGQVIQTILAPTDPANANRQQTGAFILWKGWGKKKIRKVQRNRPAGWHGNHPEQKPRERWGTRESIATIPEWVPPARTKLYGRKRPALPKAIAEMEYDDDKTQIVATLNTDDFNELFADDV